MMRLTVAVALMPSLALAQPQPWTGGSCAHGYTRSAEALIEKKR
jgi:hypothetical protein